jgi:hypothetical protein
MRMFQVMQPLSVRESIVYALETRSVRRLDGVMRVEHQKGSLLCLWPAPYASAVAEVYVDMCGCAYSQRDIFIYVSKGILREIERAPHIRRLPRP